MADRLEADAVARILGDLAGARLGDPRRVVRAQQISGRLADAPGASLPNGLVTAAELEGAYRFFNNEHVSFEDLLEAHALGTVERARGARVVLALHDTTTCKFPHADPKEVGYLSTGKAGFLLHLSLVVDTRDWRRPLGIVHAEALTRAQRSGRGARRHKVSPRQTAGWKDKEYERWFRGVRTTEDRLHDAVTKVVHVADRESDSYELMATMLGAHQRFIFRATHNRVVDDHGSKAYVRDLIERADAILEREVPLSRRLAKDTPRTKKTHPAREARIARLRFASTTANLRRPKFSNRSLSPSITVNVVHVYEQEPPTGQEPVDWLLYTTEPVDTVEQLETIVDYYRCRWLIEELNKALKTGCVVQTRQLESYDAILNMLALSLPVAVELLALRTLARAEPKRSANAYLSDGQLAALRHISHRVVPKRPTVQDVLWCIAGLGGHIKNNGQPGWQVLQRGMEKFMPFAAGWCAREAADL